MLSMSILFHKTSENLKSTMFRLFLINSYLNIQMISSIQSCSKKVSKVIEMKPIKQHDIEANQIITILLAILENLGLNMGIILVD
jgi:hypothetical protein